MSIKETVTHIGTLQGGYRVYMRKNKCGQWNILRPTRKGYRWDAINYNSEYPVKVELISQLELEGHLFNEVEVLKK